MKTPPCWRQQKMSNLSLRAFEEAQRRRLYVDRKGINAVANIQRDILIVQKNLAMMAEYIWTLSGKEVSGNFSIYNPKDHDVNKFLASAGLQLLQISGSLGIDFVSLLKHEVDKQELTIL